MGTPRNAICLVVDRLHSGFLGAYGNTWIATPDFDRFAAESVVFDRAYIDTPDLAGLYRSYWRGWHAMRRLETDESTAGELLPRQIAGWGMSFEMVTDDPVVARIGESAVANSVMLLEPTPHERVAASLEETELARFFATAAATLAEMEPPFVLWLHTGSLGRTWDAPLEFREHYADPEDPPLSDSAVVPCLRLPPDADPDELLGYMHSYAGQVSLLDACLGTLVETIAESSFAEKTLLALVSARGFPLGEHGRVGPCDEALYGELTQVPLAFRFPDGHGQSERSQALVQPADLNATLADWLGLPFARRPGVAGGKSLLPIVSGEEGQVRDRAVTSGADGGRSIVTPAWYLRLASPAGDITSEDVYSIGAASQSADLFVKPDDRFEVNDVTDRCPECVEGLKEALAQFEQSCETPDAIDPAPLADDLLWGVD